MVKEHSMQTWLLIEFPRGSVQLVFIFLSKQEANIFIEVNLANSIVSVFQNTRLKFVKWYFKWFERTKVYVSRTISSSAFRDIFAST